MEGCVGASITAALNLNRQQTTKGHLSVAQPGSCSEPLSFLAGSRTIVTVASHPSRSKALTPRIRSRRMRCSMPKKEKNKKFQAFAEPSACREPRPTTRPERTINRDRWRRFPVRRRLE